MELLSDNLLSNEQLQFEANYIRSLSNVDPWPHVNLSPNQTTRITDHVKAEFSDTLRSDYNVATNHQLTFVNFSRLVEDAQKEVDKLKEMNAAQEAWSPDSKAPSRFKP